MSSRPTTTGSLLSQTGRSGRRTVVAKATPAPSAESAGQDFVADKKTLEEELAKLQITNRTLDSTRKFYASNNAFLMLKYRLDVDKLKRQNAKLTEELSLETRTSQQGVKPRSSTNVTKLQEMRRWFDDQKGKLAQKCKETESSINDMRERMTVEQQAAGGANFAREHIMQMHRDLRKKENQVDSRAIKLNEHVHDNAKLREEIGRLRNEKKETTDKIISLRAVLEQKRKEISEAFQGADFHISEKEKILRAMEELRDEAGGYLRQAQDDWVLDPEENNNNNNNNNTTSTSLTLSDTGKGQGQTQQGQTRSLTAESRYKAAAYHPSQAPYPPGHPKRMTASQHLTARDSASSTPVPALITAKSGEQQQNILKSRAELGAWAVGVMEGRQDLKLSRAQEIAAQMTRITQETSTPSFEEFLQRYKEAKGSNDDLFQQLNLLNAELDSLEQKHKQLDDDLSLFSGGGDTHQRTRRARMLTIEEKQKALEQRLASYDSEKTQANRALESMKDGVNKLLQHLGCPDEVLRQLFAVAGFTEANMLEYLGLLEQQSSMLLRVYRRMQKRAAQQHTQAQLAQSEQMQAQMQAQQQQQQQQQQKQRRDPDEVKQSDLLVGTRMERS